MFQEDFDNPLWHLSSVDVVNFREAKTSYGDSAMLTAAIFSIHHVIIPCMYSNLASFYFKELILCNSIFFFQMTSTDLLNCTHTLQKTISILIRWELSMVWRLHLVLLLMVSVLTSARKTLKIKTSPCRRN